jgi:hypothetical protein
MHEQVPFAVVQSSGLLTLLGRGKSLVQFGLLKRRGASGPRRFLRPSDRVIMEKKPKAPRGRKNRKKARLGL